MLPLTLLHSILDMGVVFGCRRSNPSTGPHHCNSAARIGRGRIGYIRIGGATHYEKVVVHERAEVRCGICLVYDCIVLFVYEAFVIEKFLVVCLSRPFKLH